MNVSFAIILLITCLVNGSKILMVFPSPAPSHFILGNALAKGLVNAGHEITMVSPFEEQSTPKNGKYKTVLLNGLVEALKNSKLPSFKEVGDSHIIYTEIFLNGPGGLSSFLTNFTINHENFLKLIKSEEQFDVIILEQFANDGLKILSCHYKIPLISFNTLGAGFWSNSLVGNPSPPSYIPDMLLGYSNKMSLWQRTCNCVFILIRYIIRDAFLFPKQAEIIKEAFPNCYRDFNKIMYNTSLTFLNSHESTNDAVPLVPSMIPIGGFHLNSPKKLPDNLQTFMDKAKEGVIYFSLGSNIMASSIDTSTKQAFLRVFSKLKQKVLWKWDESIEEKPDNVIIQKWFPQQEVLAHPNLKLFITHGGLLSQTEAIYHGIPVLCIPVFADQKLNSAKMETDGYGLTIWLQNITEEKLMKAITSLLNDSKYRGNVKKRSSYLRDRPIKPMDLAIYWTEFVVKHKGAPHLRVAGLDLEWYQYLLLDVIAVLTISLITLSIAVYYLIIILVSQLKRNFKLKTS